MTHPSAAPGGESPPSPPPPRPVRHLSGAHHVSGAGRTVLTLRQLRAHGVAPSAVTARCRPGGPWQLLLPGVVLLRSGPVTDEERLHAALLYTVGRAPEPAGDPAAPGADAGRPPDRYGPAMITGLAALALHHFASAPPLPSLDQVDVLVPRTRRLRSTGYVRVVRGPSLPPPEDVAGVPTAPVPRALADAVDRIPEAAVVRGLLLEAVRGGHCEATAVVRELSRCRLLTRPHVADAAEAVLAEGRAVAEGRLYAMVRRHRLPEPLWNVTLRLPGGPLVGDVDAYWPDQAVALHLDMRPDGCAPDLAQGRVARTRERLERLGITVVRVAPDRLREAPADQATVVRTALMAAAGLLLAAGPGESGPAVRVVVLPR
ncbi:hypothetical protein [Streptomyces sp. NPDC018031]|uniref:hypothetical protein n=1 Tax=Streptomyces sp. NPDC018031 TaxID=3365033 RepID=UPI0037A7E0CD